MRGRVCFSKLTGRGLGFRVSLLAVLLVHTTIYGSLTYGQEASGSAGGESGTAPTASPSAAQVESRARAARDLGRYNEAELLYAQGYSLFPGQIALGVGHALSVIDQRRLGEAVILIEALEERWPDERDVLHAKAYLKDVEKDFAASIAIYQKILDAYPDDDYAYRQWTLATNFLGLPQLALAGAAERPRVFPLSDWRVMYSDRAAIAIRWASMYEPNIEIARERQQQAIDYCEFYLDYLSQHFPTETNLRLRAIYDYILAFHVSGQMLDVVIQYLHLLEEGHSGQAFPVEVLNAVASAYLYLEKPEQAINLASWALEQSPESFNSLVLLFFAAIEAEQFGRAENTIDKLAGREPGKIENYEIVDARRFRQLLFAWGNQPARADAGLSEMLNKAPYNAQIRSDLAGVYNLRGWPRMALEEYTLVQNIDPNLLERKIGQAESLFSLNRFDEFKPLIKDLARDYPENKRVESLAEDWSIRNMSEISAVASSGSSTGDTFGTQDIETEVFYFTKPLHADHRLFAHYWTSQAELEGGRVVIRRHGIGGEYRQPEWDIVLELSQSDQMTDTGLAVNGRWRPNDFSSVSFSTAEFAQDTPVRAWDQNIKAEAYTLTLQHRLSERIRINSELRHMPFSDGNIRNEYALSGYQLLYSRPHHQLALIESGSYSDNSQPDAAYFNPVDDYSLALAMEYEGILHRHYDQNFSHRLLGEFGQYFQRGFGTSEMSAVEYDQRIRFNKRGSIFYGVRYQRHSYDGNEEESLNFRVGMDWRFQ